MFSVSEHFDRMEKACLEILGAREPIDKTITLWWGLDGIQLSEDGTYKWVSRKKKQDENEFYQPCQSIQWTLPYAMPFESGTLRYGFTDQIQSTQAQIDALMAQNTQLQAQAWQAEQSGQMINALQRYVVQWPGYYERLTDCCCDQTRDRF